MDPASHASLATQYSTQALPLIDPSARRRRRRWSPLAPNYRLI